ASCCIDARQVQPGDIYVALLQADEDGHDRADEAIRRGASAVIVERLLPVAVPQYLVDDSREALGRLCHYLLGSPATQLQTVGVTGTHGKSTVTRLIESIFKAAGITAGSSHSLGWHNGFVQQPSPST